MPNLAAVLVAAAVVVATVKCHYSVVGVVVVEPRAPKYCAANAE